MPIVAVPSVEASRDFYVEKLCFDHLMGVLGKDGLIEFCTVTRGGGKVMFTRLSSVDAPKPTVDFYFQTENVDGYYETVVANGLQPSIPETMWWGDRVFIVEDNNGYRIWFYETVSQPVPPSGMKIV